MSHFGGRGGGRGGFGGRGGGRGGYGGGRPKKFQKVMTQPINLIFRFLQNKARVQIWLYEQVNMRIEGRIIVCFLSSLQIPFHYILAPFLCVNH